MPLSKNHWLIEDFSQNMTTKEYREILLAGDVAINFRGTPRELIAKKIGPGVYKVYKGKP